MRIVNVAVRQCYRFNCPNCGSKLEADSDELVDVGGKTSRFWCPVCREERYIPWSSLRKRTVYEDSSADYHRSDGSVDEFIRFSNEFAMKMARYSNHSGENQEMHEIFQTASSVAADILDLLNAMK